MWKHNQIGAESRWQVSIISTLVQTQMAILTDKDQMNDPIEQSGQNDTDAQREKRSDSSL